MTEQCKSCGLVYPSNWHNDRRKWTAKMRAEYEYYKQMALRK